MFAATGSRVGWLIGPSWIMHPTLAATTRIVFCSNSPMQEAVATGLEQVASRGFIENQLQEYTERRKILTDALDKLGAKYTLPEGTYFLLLVRYHYNQRVHLIRPFVKDISDLKWPEDYPFPDSVLGRGRDFK